MASIPTFGFSAFLRVICLNEKPQKTAIFNRHSPAEDGGYDYHRKLKSSIQSLASGSRSLREVLKEIALIKSPSERRSTKQGVVKFLRWLSRNGSTVTFCEPIVFDSPLGLFKVRFEANCVVEINGRRTALHVWNTQQPKLREREVIAALKMVQRVTSREADLVDDFAVLSLRDGHLYKWSDNPSAYKKFADSILIQLDRLCSLARAEYGLPQIKQGPDPAHPYA